jgi:hypothetical protein
MSEEEQTLLLIKGAISDLPAEKQLEVNTCAAQLRAVVIKFGDAGLMACALVCAEVQAGRLD